MSDTVERRAKRLCSKCHAALLPAGKKLTVELNNSESSASTRTFHGASQMMLRLAGHNLITLAITRISNKYSDKKAKKLG